MPLAAIRACAVELCHLDAPPTMPNWRAALTDAVERLTLTRDPTTHVLRVSGLLHGGWLDFAAEPASLDVVAMPASIQYDELITGIASPPLSEITAAWRLAAAARALRVEVPHEVGVPAVPIDPVCVRYLAVRDRVERFDGFEQDPMELAALERRLDATQRAFVDARVTALAGYWAEGRAATLRDRAAYV